MPTEIGSARADAGETARGYLDVTDLPTGTPERLPVVVTEGATDGPTVWVTASVHGDEATGLAVAHDVVDALDPEAVRGTVVCLPTLNPAGLRRNERTSYYHDEDPNRGFPGSDLERHRPPTVQELVDERVYERFSDADCLLDLHTATVGSMPFVIRDRVLYGAERTREEAETLAEDLAEVARATGLALVNEYLSEEYVDEALQRSTAGAALNGAGIPAVTFELGTHSVVDETARETGLAGVFGVLDHLDVVDSVPTTADHPTPEVPVEYPVRRERGPVTETAGVVRHHAAAGDVVDAGDVVAKVVTPTGEPIAAVTADHDGYVLGRREGVAVYENDPLYSMAVRDDGDLVAPREGSVD